MKRTGVLHAELSRVIAGMGHGDMLVIADAGLPVPKGVPCIDLAVTLGVPGFADVLTAVMLELVVERAQMAEEASDLPRRWVSEAGVPVPQDMSHEAFKAACSAAVAVVRTGEGTPYANVALFAGVSF